MRIAEPAGRKGRRCPGKQSVESPVASLLTIVAMSMVRAGIGAGLRIEWRAEPRHLAAEPLNHIGDDMVVADAQPPLERLHR